MEYLETGNFTLNLEKLPSLRILPRALMSRSSEVEIFIGERGVYLYAHDLSSDVRYIAQESDVKIETYKSNAGVKMVNSATGGFDDELDMDLDDLDLSIINDEMFKVDLADMAPYREEFEDMGPEDEDDDNWMDDIGPQVSRSGDINDGAEGVGEGTEKTADERFCRFATSADIIKVFGLFKEVNIDVGEKEITVSNNKEGTVAKFPRTKSYSKLDQIKQMIGEFEWENFPLEQVKSILPLTESIEPKKYKQSISIAGGRLYTFSDIIAVETYLDNLERDYLLNSEVLRILKYSTGKDTDVRISQNNKGALGIYVDSLIVLFGPMDRVNTNLFDITRGGMETEPFIESVSKGFTDKLKTMKTIFPNNLEVTITTWDNIVILNNERMQSIFPPTARISNNKRIVVDIEKMLMALRLAGSDNPKIALYSLKGNKAVMVLEGTVDVLIDVEEYYSGIKEL